MVLSIRILQWLLIVVYCISLDVRAASHKNVLKIKDKQGNTVYISVKAEGCFGDGPSRALRNMYYNFRQHIKWALYPDTSDIIKACAEKAYRESFKYIFAVQYYGECWSDGRAESRYKKYGKSSNCEYGVGKDWANMVYRYKVVPKPLTCHVNGREYSEGDRMMIYSNSTTADPNKSRCTACTCTAGEAKNCKGFICESEDKTLCLKFKYLPGQCCPVCDCDNNGQKMEVGCTWLARRDSTCAECTCEAKSIAKCVIKECKCYGEFIPIENPGKCCPKCVAKTTTSAPPQTIQPQTDRPKLTLPPRPVN